MKLPAPHTTLRSALWLLLLATLLIRAITLEIPDLIDPTESRYATVAQHMVLTGDWLTPYLPMPEGTVPYLGKPPLHFWITAISLSVFGIDEWTTRLPSFLALLSIVGTLLVLGQTLITIEVGLIAALLTISSGLMFFFSGASVVDVTLSATVTIAIGSFAIATLGAGKVARIAGYLVFAALGLGMLTKGPVAIALFGLPVALWITINNRWPILKRLPWIGGIALFLIITIPWFLLEEQAHPGFLEYFFITENFGRYLVEQYGDRYGTGHVYPWGSIWWMLLVAALPWSLAIFSLFSARSRQAVILWTRSSPVASLWLIWGLTPAIFFTFARQLHTAYVLPGIPGLALWLAGLLVSLPAFAGSAAILTRLVRGFSLLLFTLFFAVIVTGIFFKVSPVMLACSVVPFFAMAKIIHWHRRATLDASGQIGVLAILLVVTYTGILFQATEYINDKKSTQNILSLIADNTAEREPLVGVIAVNNYSFYFYTISWSGEISKALKIVYVDPTIIEQTTATDLVIGVKDLKKISAQIEQNWAPQGTVGRWTWLKRKLKPTANS